MTPKSSPTSKAVPPSSPAPPAASARRSRGAGPHGRAVILTARDRARGEAAGDEIAATTGARDLDLRWSISPRRAASARCGRGAGRPSETSRAREQRGGLVELAQAHPDGIEQTWATNVLGYFLLTQLLLENLQAGGAVPHRERGLGSALDLDLTDVGFERRRYSGNQRLRAEQAANRLWTVGAGPPASPAPASPRTAMHPGGVADRDLCQRGRAHRPCRAMLSALSAVRPAQGADTAIWLAASPEVEGQTASSSRIARSRPACIATRRSKSAVVALRRDDRRLAASWRGAPRFDGRRSNPLPSTRFASPASTRTGLAASATDGKGSPDAAGQSLRRSRGTASRARHSRRSRCDRLPASGHATATCIAARSAGLVHDGDRR